MADSIRAHNCSPGGCCWRPSSIREKATEKKNCEGGIEIKWILRRRWMRHKRIFIPIRKAKEKGGGKSKESNEATPFILLLFFFLISETGGSNVRHLSVWRRSFGRRPTAGSLLWLSISPGEGRSINSFHIFQQLYGSDCCGFLVCCVTAFSSYSPPLSGTIPSPRQWPTHSILTIFRPLSRANKLKHTRTHIFLSVSFSLILGGSSCSVRSLLLLLSISLSFFFFCFFFFYTPQKRRERERNIGR